MSTNKTLLAKSINNDTAAATVTGSAVPVEFFPIIGVQGVWTGTVNGTITLEGSMDGTNYSAIAGVSIAPAGTPSAGISVPTATFNPHQFVRAVFTRTSGSGLLNVYISGKQ